MNKYLVGALLALSSLQAHAKVRTLQVTLGASATPLIASGDVYFKWLVIQDNATHSVRVGDASVSGSRGLVLLSTGPGGGSVMQQPWGPPLTGDLAAWFLFGTAGDVIDVIYDDGAL